MIKAQHGLIMSKTCCWCCGGDMISLRETWCRKITQNLRCRRLQWTPRSDHKCSLTANPAQICLLISHYFSIPYEQYPKTTKYLNCIEDCHLSEIIFSGQKPRPDGELACAQTHTAWRLSGGDCHLTARGSELHLGQVGLSESSFSAFRRRFPPTRYRRGLDIGKSRSTGNNYQPLSPLSFTLFPKKQKTYSSVFQWITVSHIINTLWFCLITKSLLWECCRNMHVCNYVVGQLPNRVCAPAKCAQWPTQTSTQSIG